MILDDIATYVDSNSTALALNTNLFKSILLDSTTYPHSVVVLYEPPGSPNSYVFSTSSGGATVSAEHPALQVLSRSTAYQTARNRAQTVYTLLDGLSEQNLPTSTSTGHYNEITAVQAPFFLERDNNDRFIVAVNFNVSKTP